jgi:hypothetical protein
LLAKGDAVFPAVTGKGLATYINQHVRENYARKLSE